VNLYITGSNIFFNEDISALVDTQTGTEIDSILSGAKILMFKKAFLEKGLQLTNEKDPLFIKYMYFLKNELKITHPSLIYSGNISRRKQLKIGTRDQHNQFFQTFYSSLGADAEKQTLLLDIDFITFMLWMCATEMPLGTATIGNTIPKLNPMSQMWIYSDIVKESIVNNEYKKLLAMGNIPTHNNKKGHDLEITFTEPLFKTLGVSRLDEINIIIATKFGNPCPFADGPSTVQLRFEAESLY
jgi:hypothetical protein